MNLLISNDDGVFSAGLSALVAALKPHHTVTVVAPEQERSGEGHSINFLRPVRVREVSPVEGVPAFAVDGTPADCVRIGCTSLGLSVDAVVSGINHGGNLGSDILYSGTVGAAMEGALLGKPAIAVSCNNYRPANFSAAARAALWTVDYIQKHPLPPGMILNVNAPEIPARDVKGVRLAGLCLQTYGGVHTSYTDESGARFFQMPLDDKTTSFLEGDDYDERWVREGYVTITPIHYDIACYSYMKQMDISGFQLFTDTDTKD